MAKRKKGQKPPCPMQGCLNDGTWGGNPCANCRTFDWRWRQRTLVECLARGKQLDLWRNRMDSRIERGRGNKALKAG